MLPLNCLLIVTLGAASFLPAAGDKTGRPIDRQALVARHNPVLRQFDPESPLSVGNGEFAFTVDATGLQTFPDAFEQTIPLGTLSNRGWHTFPNPEGWTIDKFPFKEFDTHGRMVGYADIPGDRRTPEITWLRANPHRLHLGRVGFLLRRADGRLANPADLQDIEQTLDLWNGLLTSRFKIDGDPVIVQTVCHPTLDVVAVRVESALLGTGRLTIQLRFPYGTGATVTADWSQPDRHETLLRRLGPSLAQFQRRLDNDRYYARLQWDGPATLLQTDRHDFDLEPGRGADALELRFGFSPAAGISDLPGFKRTADAAREQWRRFWQSGGAIDLSGSKDPRWRELERRIVLSQYLTAIQCAGSFPPQETGLTYNSWEGKFHLEMHWWHAAHFALWGRLPMLEKSLGYYQKILPKARGTARRQGYTGARWPKMTGPAGDESPSSVGPFLIWQQPHPIYYAELCYRERPDRKTLEEYREVVSETAEFMASYAWWDESGQRYILGPPLQCAQEVFPKDRTFNPTYEITHWRWGLETAQKWRERLGMAREPSWDKVLAGLSKPPVRDGKYLFAESAPESYTDPRWANDHPSVVAALGALPGPGIDPAIMRATLDWIWKNWNWPDTWGWDYPMLAMTAARLGQPERAIDALLLETPKNHYRLNGHNHQRPGLTIYLPGNGGLLAAVAMMAAGWDGGPEKPAPGFPDNGQWVVRYEGLKKMP